MIDEGAIPAPVSVVIPARNREAQVGTAIESINAQTLLPREIIVVDDGSTDRTADVALSHSSSAVALKLIRLPVARGAQAARNAGILAASAEWIAFLDSDDEWLPDSLRLRMTMADESQADVVHSGCLVIEEPDSRPRPMGIPAVHGHAWRQLLRAPGPVFQSLLVRRDAIAQIGLLDEQIVSFQEWETCIRLARRHTFAFLPEPTFIYNCCGQARISNDHFRSFLGYRQILKKHRLAMLLNLGPKAWASHCRQLSSLLAAAQLPIQSRRWATIGFLLWPFRLDVLVRRLRKLGRFATKN